MPSSAPMGKGSFTASGELAGKGEARVWDAESGKPLGEHALTRRTSRYSSARQQFRDRFERYIARNQDNLDLGGKALTAILPPRGRAWSTRSPKAVPITPFFSSKGWVRYRLKRRIWGSSVEREKSGAENAGGLFPTLTGF